MMPTQLTDAHRRLDRLVGTWEGVDRSHPSPAAPDGAEGIGRVTYRSVLDGLALVQDYEHEHEGAIAFRTHGVFRWDPDEAVYVLHSFDSFGMPPDVFRGTFEDGVFRFATKNAMGHFRFTIELGEDAYETRVETSEDGESWKPMLDGSYRRKGGD